MSNTNTNADNDIHLDSDEVLLQEVDNRFVLFPIKYNQIWQMYKKAESAFWTAEEVDLSKDMDDWEKLTDKEQFFIKHILAFFAGSDGIVNENLGSRFMNDVKVLEAKTFYGFQIMMENIHCVSKNTEILTSDGYATIGNLEGKVANVWNGEEYSNVMIMKTHDAAPAFSVKLSNGMSVTCTPNHDWLVYGVSGKVHTTSLEVGMMLQPFEYPVIDTEYDHEIFSNAQDHGYMCGESMRDVTFNPMKYNCRPRLLVPVNFGIRTKTEWLRGLMSHADVVDDSDKVCVRLEHSNDEFKKHVVLLLSTFNVFASYEATVLYLDVWQAAKLIETVSGGDILTETQRSRIKTRSESPRPYEYFEIQVCSVENMMQNVAMYCFEEPKRHTGVFNGILTGQSEVYSLLIDTYIKDGLEKNRLLNAMNTVPCIKKKAEWAMKWIVDKEARYAKRLIAFAAVEGIFFSGAFCSIFWLKERGLMPGLCSSNEFISRDESLHTEFAILLYTMLKHKLHESTVHDIIREAVSIEDEFINDSIPCALLGMNSNLMSQYIKFVADRLVVQLGYNRIYNVTNPFHFMERIALGSKTNFFEHRVAEYARPMVNDKEKPKFALDEDF
jgi:ribonucleotide reductase beta subunit family protein with ferritin-like domain